MGDEPDSWDLLLLISRSVGGLSISLLDGVSRGAVMSLSMSVSALLEAKVPPEAFSSLHSMFSGLPCETEELETLFSSLLSVCLLAQDYEQDKANAVLLGLIALSPESLPSQYN